MATSYTNLLGFALPVTGELNGAWGDVVNNSITELVEDSIAGSATASVTSGDWTLTTTGSGVSNQARSAILIPTGTPGTTRNIIAPSSSKAYIVDNKSDGAVVLKGSATTGATVAAGTTALVAWDGSDFVLVSQSLSNAIGTLAVSKGGTGLTATPTNGQIDIGNGSGFTRSTLTAGSGVTITNGSGSISISATGTGGTVTSVDVSGGTTGLTTSGGPITGAGTITLAGTLAVANGGTGLTAPGTSGNLLTSNGTAWVSSASSVGTLTAVASGSLSDGSAAIINADGTVSAVSGSLPVVFSSIATFGKSSVYDVSNNKIVIAYVGTSGYGTAIVGTVSGNTITFGTPVVFKSADTSSIQTVYDSTNNKVVISYTYSGAAATIVGTVSGTSISFGTEVAFKAVSTALYSSVFVSSGKIVNSYRVPPSNSGRAIVGTVSGTSISFGTEVVFVTPLGGEDPQSIGSVASTYDSANDKVVIAYTLSGGGSPANGTAIVGTVSGTSISFGTPVVFRNASTSAVSAAYSITENKVVFAYVGAGSNAIVGSVFGTSITFGTQTTFFASASNFINTIYDSTNNKIVILYASNYGNSVLGTISGSNISFGTPLVFESANTYTISAAYNSSDQKIVVAYTDGGNSNYGTSIVFAPNATSITNLLSNNYIGMSNAAYTNGQTATIQINGSIDDAQSGLTPAQTYYVLANGSLSTTQIDGSFSVLAGLAVASNKIIIKG